MLAVLCIMGQRRGSNGRERNEPRNRISNRSTSSIRILRPRVSASCDPAFKMRRDRRCSWVFEGLRLAADFRAGRLTGSERERLSVPTASREASDQIICQRWKHSVLDYYIFFFFYLPPELVSLNVSEWLCRQPQPCANARCWEVNHNKPAKRLKVFTN